jgi:hypothetical protein
MTAPAPLTAPRTERLYLGWQYATPCPDPGPPPRRPTPPEREQINSGWVAAQRREENLLSRPLKAVCAVSAAALAVLVAAALAGWLNVVVAILGACCAALAAGISGNAIWQGERALRSRVAAERRRVEDLRTESERKLFAWQAEHAARVREWQLHRVAFEQQKRWYAVAAPGGIHRVDVAGGTLSGWSAMLTTAGAFRLAAGGEVTVLDLTGSAVALDLIAFARSAQLPEPQVWVLPEDLPRFDLGRGLRGQALADVLSLAVSVSEEQGTTRDLSFDNAILERVIDVLGGQPTIAGVVAALRALAQVGNPADDVAAGVITSDQVDSLRAMFGKGAADRVVIDRAWTLESQLRKLAKLGTSPALPQRSNLRVVALSKQAGVLDGKVLGAYLAVALTHALRGAEHGSGWQHTLFVLGADTLRGDVLDRLTDACESSGTGLVLGYRALGPHVKQRLGRGEAAVVFMRLGNAEDARAASEQIGTEHRFVLSQLTETVGQSVTDSTGGSYTSTAGRTDSVTTSQSSSDSSSVTTGRGSGRESGLLPLTRATSSRNVQASESLTTGEAESVSAGLSLSTAWGQTTSIAEGSTESTSYAAQRSREFLVEQHELQQLPSSAMIVSYAGPAGRVLMLADANPGIGALGDATMSSLDEYRGGTPQEPVREKQPSRQGFGAEPPNLGPPPPRLDWRRRQS